MLEPLCVAVPLGLPVGVSDGVPAAESEAGLALLLAVPDDENEGGSREGELVLRDWEGVIEGVAVTVGACELLSEGEGVAEDDTIIEVGVSEALPLPVLVAVGVAVELWDTSKVCDELDVPAEETAGAAD